MLNTIGGNVKSNDIDNVVFATERSPSLCLIVECGDYPREDEPGVRGRPKKSEKVFFRPAFRRMRIVGQANPESISMARPEFVQVGVLRKDFLKKNQSWKKIVEFVRNHPQFSQSEDADQFHKMSGIVERDSAWLEEKVNESKSFSGVNVQRGPRQSRANGIILPPAPKDAELKIPAGARVPLRRKALTVG